VKIEFTNHGYNKIIKIITNYTNRRRGRSSSFWRFFFEISTKNQLLMMI